MKRADRAVWGAAAILSSQLLGIIGAIALFDTLRSVTGGSWGGTSQPWGFWPSMWYASLVWVAFTFAALGALWWLYQNADDDLTDTLQPHRDPTQP